MVPDYLFKDVYRANSLGRQCLLAGQRQICLLTRMKRISLLMGQRFASSPLKSLGFRKLEVPQLGCRPTTCAASTWTSSPLPHGTGEQGEPM